MQGTMAHMAALLAANGALLAVAVATPQPQPDATPTTFSIPSAVAAYMSTITTEAIYSNAIKNPNEIGAAADIALLPAAMQILSYGESAWSTGFRSWIASIDEVEATMEPSFYVAESSLFADYISTLESCGIAWPPVSTEFQVTSSFTSSGCLYYVDPTGVTHAGGPPVPLPASLSSLEQGNTPSSTIRSSPTTTTTATATTAGSPTGSKSTAASANASSTGGAVSGSYNSGTQGLLGTLTVALLGMLV